MDRTGNLKISPKKPIKTLDLNYDKVDFLGLIIEVHPDGSIKRMPNEKAKRKRDELLAVGDAAGWYHYYKYIGAI
jgi:hypothetical protein